MTAGRVHDRKIDVAIDDKEGCDRYTSRQVHRHRYMTAGRVHDRRIVVEIDDKEGVAKDTQMTYDRRTSA